MVIVFRFQKSRLLQVQLAKSKIEECLKNSKKVMLVFELQIRRKVILVILTYLPNQSFFLNRKSCVLDYIFYSKNFYSFLLLMWFGLINKTKYLISFFFFLFSFFKFSALKPHFLGV